MCEAGNVETHTAALTSVSRHANTSPDLRPMQLLGTLSGHDPHDWLPAIPPCSSTDPSVSTKVTVTIASKYPVSSLTGSMLQSSSVVIFSQETSGQKASFSQAAAHVMAISIAPSARAGTTVMGV